MLTTVVLVLAGITAWCVASLALALIVGPMVRKADRSRAGDLPLITADRPERDERAARAERPALTGAIPISVAH